MPLHPVTGALRERPVHGRSNETIVRNFFGSSPGSCRLASKSPGSHSFGSNARLLVLKETWPSPQRALIPVGFLAVVCGRVLTALIRSVTTERWLTNCDDFSAT